MTIQLNSKEERDSLQEKLKENGIQSMIYYIKPMHKQRAFEDYHFDDSDYPNTIQLCNKVLSLPMHPYLSREDIMKVIDVILQWAE